LYAILLKYNSLKNIIFILSNLKKMMDVFEIKGNLNIIHIKFVYILNWNINIWGYLDTKKSMIIKKYSNRFTQYK